MKKFNKAGTIMIFISMIFSAVADNTKGIFIPVFKSNFHINDTKIGFMLTSASIGYIIFTYVGGILCEKSGQKKVFLYGFTAIASSLFMLSCCTNFSFLAFAMFVMNIGLSMCAIATNTVIPILFLNYQAIIMNFTHFCYGLGSSVGQSIIGMLIFKGISWRKIYFTVGFIYIVIFIIFSFIKIPEAHKAQKPTERNNNIGKGSKIKNKLIIFYAAALGTYVFAETATGNWFVNYMNKVFYLDTDRSSFYLALFFGIFALGRLIGGFVVEKKGYLNTVLLSLIIAALLYTSGIILKGKGLMLISVSSFFFSIVFPTLVLSASKTFKERSSYITGIIITCASTSNMLLNLLMGHLNDTIGIYQTFYIIPASLCASIVCVFVLYKYTKTATN